MTWQIARLITIGRDETWAESQFDYLKETSNGRYDMFYQLSLSEETAKAVDSGSPNFVDDQKMVEISREVAKISHTMSPDELIEHAKKMLREKFGAADCDDKWLTDDFVFLFPIIYMPDRASFLDLIKAGLSEEPNKDAKTFNYGWQVDCFEPNRVWYMERTIIKVKGKWTPLSVQQYSLSFCPKTGKCYKHTGGYVIDRSNNYKNTGGFGAAFGVLMANGVRIPIPEHTPYYPSLEYRSWLTFLYGTLTMWKPRPDAGIYEGPINLGKRIGKYFS